MFPDFGCQIFTYPCNVMYVTSFLVFHTIVTVNIGLKKVVRMVTSIPLIECLCYKPERINKDIGVETTDTNTCLTLSNTKQETDLGTLVVPFNQTFHPLHVCMWDQ